MIVGGALTVLLGITEAVLQRLYVARGEGFLGQHERYVQLRENTPSTRMANYQTVEGERREFVLHTDASGYIMPSDVHTAPDVKIVFLGGSTTECLLVSEEARFPARTGRLLEQGTGLKVNTYNAGRSASNSLHSLNVLLNKAAGMKPHLAVMMHNVNDLGFLMANGSYWSETAPEHIRIIRKFEANASGQETLGSLARRLKNSLIPYTWLAVRSAMARVERDFAPATLLSEGETQDLDIPEQVRADQLAPQELSIVADFARAQRAFVSLTRALGIRPVLMTQARADVIPANANRADMALLTRHAVLHAYLNQVIRDVGAETGVRVIDLERFVKKHPDRRRFFYDSVHYGDVGSLAVADLITNDLAAEIAEMRTSRTQ